MNILQIISGRDVNGALVYCKLLSEELVRAGHRVSILCRTGSWIASRPIEGVEVMESDLDRFPPGELRRIAAWIGENQVDIVHTHMSRAHNFGVLLKSFCRIPVVATAHAQYIQLHWRFNDLVLANSSATARFHRRYNLVPASKIRTVFCFADLDRFLKTGTRLIPYVRGELHARDGRFLIGVVGEVIARKGHRYLFEAMPAILEKIPDARLVVIGRFHRQEKCTRALRLIQKKLKLHRRIHWLGRRDNVNAYLSTMNVVVVPSIVEPLGLVAVEAQAVGVPVVASNVGGLPEIVRHGESGLLVPARDPAAIASAVVRLHEDESLRLKIVANGKAEAAQLFDPARLTAQVVEAYQELMASFARR